MVSTTSNVLYFTNTDDPVPLSHAFHATASRTLSTSLPTEIASQTTDVDSAYCPQCLTSWDVSTAFSAAKGRCCKPLSSSSEEQKQGVGCVSCPECSGILVVSVVTNDCWKSLSSDGLSGGDGDGDGEGDGNGLQFSHVVVYKCGYCHWDSSECNLFQTFDIKLQDEAGNATSTSGDDKMKIASIQLQQKLSERLEMTEETESFRELCRTWQERVEKISKNMKRMNLLNRESGSGSSSSGNHSGRIANKIMREEEKKNNASSSKWSVEALEHSITQRRQYITEAVNKNISSVTHSILTIHDDIQLESNSSNRKSVLDPIQMARQETVLSSSYHTHALPVPLCLRPRVVRRCVKESEAGRPGILVKPKVNPLEGDSSLRYGHGQWFKKDSSAIYSVPKVQLKSYVFNKSTNQFALLLQIKNPTLGPVRLCLHANVEESPEVTLNNLIIDSMTLQREDIHIIQEKRSTESSNVQTEMLQLEPAEDTFLGIGQTAKAHTDDWGRDKTTIDWSNFIEKSSWNVISIDNDTAWVQYTTTATFDANLFDHGQFVATLMKLEVEVGDHSWESSLIQAKENTNQGKDSVTFKILPVWKYLG